MNSDVIWILEFDSPANGWVKSQADFIWYSEEEAMAVAKNLSPKYRVSKFERLSGAKSS